MYRTVVDASSLFLRAPAFGSAQQQCLNGGACYGRGIKVYRFLAKTYFSERRGLLSPVSSWSVILLFSQKS